MSQWTSHRRKDYPRACDTCGRLEWFSKMKYVGLNRWVCPDDRKMLTAEQIARHQAKPLPHLLPAKPRRHPQPMTYVGVYPAEGEVLNMVIEHGDDALWLSPTGQVAFAGRSIDIGCSMMYLGDLLADGERPSHWETAARAKLLELADTVLSRQYGSLTGPSPSTTVTSLLYGGVRDHDSDDGAINPQSAISCGLGLLRAYAQTGVAKYRDGIARVAHFLRNTQRLDCLTSGFSANDAGGTARFYLGGWPINVTTATKIPSSSFPSGNAFGLWFLSELADLVGSSTQYGTAAGGDFASATTGTVAEMLSEARRFYFEGRIGDTGTATAIAPVSATTPKDRYLSFGCSGAGDGLFHLIDDERDSTEVMVDGHEFALAVRGLYEYEGYTATVAALYEWLMSFTSNAEFDTDKVSLRALVAGIFNYSLSAVSPDLTGEYDPTLSLSRFLKVKTSAGATTAVNGYPGYQLSTMGILAPVHIASGRSLKTLKDELQRKTKPLPSGENFYPLTCATVGFDWQADHTLYPQPIYFVPNAALAAGIYRYPPQAHGLPS
jgi:hypothetical protein